MYRVNPHVSVVGSGGSSVVGFLNFLVPDSTDTLPATLKTQTAKHGFQNDPQDFFTKPRNQAWQTKAAYSINI